MSSRIATVSTGKLNGTNTIVFLDNFWINQGNNFVDIYCPYTVKSYTDRVSCHCHIGYEIEGSGEDTVSVTVSEANENEENMTTMEYFEQKWHASGGGGTRTQSLFPLLCVFNLNVEVSLNRWIKVRIQNKSADDDLQLRSIMHFDIKQIKN